ncbi:MAG: ligand-binding sensor domain-containing protein, partial [Saprospiraceae bacterium]
MYLKIKYIFLFLLSTLPCFGQVDYLTISDGLPHNTVYCVLQDSDGYIWVGTQNGLAKYDGYTFEVYVSKVKDIDNQGFKGNKISALYEDKEGNLWVGTETNGLNIRKSDNDYFENLKNDAAFSDIKGYEITSISEDKQANILIGTLGGGVLIYNPQSSEVQHFETQNSGLSNNSVFDVKMDNYERMWVATAGYGLNLLQENGQFVISHEMEPNGDNMSGYRKKILVEGDYIWLTVEGNGLYHINVKTLDYRRFSENSNKNKLNSNSVLDVLRGDDGLIYIALDGNGMNIYDEEKDKMSFYHGRNEKTALNSNSLVCFLKDRMGDIWIGTYNGGLNIIKNQKTWFEFLHSESSGGGELGHRSVLSVFQTRDSTIWVGTDGGGLNRLVEENSSYIFDNLKKEENNPNSLSGNVV